MSLTVLQAIVLITLCVLNTFADRTEIVDDSMVRDGLNQDDLRDQRLLDEIRENPFRRFIHVIRSKTMAMCDSPTSEKAYNFKHLHNVDCRPFPTLVPVEPASAQVDDTVLPSFISLHRCGGDCYRHESIYRCTTIKSETVNVNVHIQRGSNIRHCIVPMTNDTWCGCSCVHNANECNPETHEWRESECLCVCKEELWEWCLLKGISYKWNDKTCTCETKKRKRSG
ncbi:uncharacterized protein LOC110242082 isoform X1 [Exaiptasia diaphana]|uniref:Platelet-derived growth factor (PDGF) family profile domain-containing protein n=1 Tax=Exaiptasia diaphana TaxID=2652724 RepID=A0A913YL66_EXADI|nr:uncharacterized protein LOC110242082 isoform X1 [Exaiptasia diaphana]